MPDKVFIDTNILVYAHTDVDLYKQGKSQSVILENSSVVSTQVIQELVYTLSRKFKLP